MSDTRVEVAARAIAESRFLGAIRWDDLREHEQLTFRCDATLALAALDAHAEGCVWEEIIPPGKNGALPFVHCELCGESGWRLP